VHVGRFAVLRSVATVVVAGALALTAAVAVPTQSRAPSDVRVVRANVLGSGPSGLTGPVAPQVGVNVVPATAPREVIATSDASSAAVTTLEAASWWAALAEVRGDPDGEAYFFRVGDHKRSISTSPDYPCWGGFDQLSWSRTVTQIGPTEYETVVALTLRNTGNRARTYVSSSDDWITAYVTYSGPIVINTRSPSGYTVSFVPNLTIGRGETVSKEYVWRITYPPGAGPGSGASPSVVTQDPAAGELPC
jgi:hypothetical protein